MESSLTPAPTSTPSDIDTIPAHHASPVVAFIIGLAIIILASILNAAGLNITKLDHVRTSAIPKKARRRDWMRPLWLFGMILYILSQVIGSTLALEYMRAEYVAPLGSSSLIFNFLFARFLVGTPVTSTDIYGTIIVIVGVIGIVAFGSINSGFATETDVAHVTFLWRRGGWLGFFFAMAFALVSLLVFTSKLDAILSSRAELTSMPLPNIAAHLTDSPSRPPDGGRSRSKMVVVKSILETVKRGWDTIMVWIVDGLEAWTAPKDDKQVAWTLGIGWACCGGGLAGGCLVFAKATVKLLSGSLSRQNPGNQFGHAAPIFTIILLATTAVLQILCLNRGLKVYDSTLVVPVFYGVYTATGFLDSLIFNDEVDAYKSWTLFLIFVSILVLISGVVLLTHKKPESLVGKVKSTALSAHRGRSSSQRIKKLTADGDPGIDQEGDVERDGEGDVLWALGEASDGEDEGFGEDEDVDHHQHPLNRMNKAAGGSQRQFSVTSVHEESRGLMDREADTIEIEHEQEFRKSIDPFRDSTI